MAELFHGDDVGRQKDLEIISEFYVDGVRRKRPRTRRMTRLLAEVQGSVQDYEPNVVDTLPDEVLQLVLARMEPTELLPLRLVCRRWDEVVRSPAVWRGRTLLLNFGGEGQSIRSIPGVVKLIPVCDNLLVNLNHQRPAARFLESLTEGHCRVRSLKLVLALGQATIPALAALLAGLQGCLEQLELAFKAGCRPTDDVVQCLKAVDALGPQLRRLTLSTKSNDNYNFDASGFRFQALRGLEELRLDWDSTVLPASVEASLLEANRASLRLVQCPPSTLHAVASCSGLRELVVRTDRPLLYLRRVAPLSRLTLECHTSTELAHAADGILDGEPLAAACLHVSVRMELWYAADKIKSDDLSWFLQRVGRHLHALTLKMPRNYWGWGMQAPWPADVVACLELVPALRTLTMQCWQPALLQGWCAQTAPALTRLELETTSVDVREAAAQLAKVRTHLDVVVL